MSAWANDLVKVQSPSRGVGIIVVLLPREGLHLLPKDRTSGKWFRV